ncbi:phage major capsid protein [Paenibacillus sp. 1011MAR3C5]|nr:phage major capsid protein [Paenibacillus sp. 1011MAR3C5]
MMQARAAKHTGMKALLDKAETEKRELTPEEEAQFNALDSEYEQLTAQIQAAEEAEGRKSKIASRENELGKPTGQPYRPSASALGGMPVQQKKMDDGGFTNLGEMINAVRFGDTRGRLSELPVNQNQGGGYKVPDAFVASMRPQFRNEWQMGTGEDGGFAVPVQQDTSRLLQLNYSNNIVRSRAQVLPAGDPPDAAITIPAFSQGADGSLGGITVTWIAEGADKPETDAKLFEVTLTPQEVAATTVATDKLLRNWSAGSAFITSLLRQAMNTAEEIAFLTGNGVGKPTGVLTAANTGAISVNRATSGTVTYLDVLTMLARLLMSANAQPIFIANQYMLPQIASIRDDDGKIIFGSGDASKGIPATLLGIPIHFTDKVPASGSRGDLSLIDFNQYLIKDGSGPFVAASEHVLFRSNKTVIKCFWNVDGKPWSPAPLTLENGVIVSPYVILDVPAGP